MGVVDSRGQCHAVLGPVGGSEKCESCDVRCLGTRVDGSRCTPLLAGDPVCCIAIKDRAGRLRSVDNLHVFFFCVTILCNLPCFATAIFSLCMSQVECVSLWRPALVQSCALEVVDGAISRQVRMLWRHLAPQEFQWTSGWASRTRSLLCCSPETAPFFR
jgi:hypothetical protein